NNTNKETFTVLSTAGNKVTLSGNVANVYYEGDKLRVIEAQVNVDYSPADGNGGSETWPNLQLVAGDDNIVTYLNENSNYITVTQGQGFSPNLLGQFPTAVNGGWQTLAGG